MSIGERLKQLRQKAGYNKKEVAEKLKMPYTTYNNYETDAREAGSETLKKVANLYNVSIDYILENEPNKWEPVITEKDQKDIKNIIEAIKNQLATENGLMYDGEPMDEESRANVLAAIEVAERTAILEAKRKFTPNIHKK